MAQTKSRFRKLFEWHVDLAILWKEKDNLTYVEIIDRLCAWFGEDVRVTKSALEKRIAKRKQEWLTGSVGMSHFIQPKDLSNKELADWFRTQMFMQAQVALYNSDFPEFRRATELTTKVIRLQEELAGRDGEDDEDALGKAIREAAQKGQEALHKEFN